MNQIGRVPCTVTATLLDGTTVVFENPTFTELGEMQEEVFRLDGTQRYTSISICYSPRFTGTCDVKLKA